MITAQVESNNAQLLANPVIVTVENKPATITISEEEPYQEVMQSLTGPPMTSTQFKDIGTVLEVTPRVTHDEHILVDVSVKQSSLVRYTPEGSPVEAKREADTTLRTSDGQTIFIGGLRRFDDTNDVTKLPVLGDIPVLNFAFRHNNKQQRCTELLLFLTCNILPDEMPELTPQQQAEYERLDNAPLVPDAQRALGRDALHPLGKRSPFWKRERMRSEQGIHTDK
ncbi:MAG TPA: type II and III secretion system protein [Candidatus Hydrogenedentes bacterium]|nr:type II and III secretion system protein [Candidatus Hydrogenedentota bacterium]